MKIISWNINGWNAMMKKEDFYNMIKQHDPDILCLQEIKLNKKKPLRIQLENYNVFENISDKPGYSGTAILYKKEIKATFDKNDFEGRICTMKTNDFTLINVYTPNSGQDLKRLKYRVEEWDPAFSKMLQTIDNHLIVVGDLNVARTENDIANPKGNKRNAGFTQEERESFENILKETNLTDVWRETHRNQTQYTFWSYFGKARDKNIGWRIDYILSNESKKIKEIEILDQIKGSDHAPIYLKTT